MDPETLNKISKFSMLDDNWDSYGAARIKWEAIGMTIYLLNALNLSQPEAMQVVPMSNGNIQLELHERGVDIEIEVNGMWPISFYCEHGWSRPEIIERDIFNVDELRSKIADYALWLMHSE